MKNKLILTAIAALLLLGGIPNYAEAEPIANVVATKTFYVDETVETNGIKGSHGSGQFLALNPGNYLLTLVFDAVINQPSRFSYARASSFIEGYRIGGGIGIDVASVSKTIYESTIGKITQTVNFSISDDPAYGYAWYTEAVSSTGSLNYTVSISQVTAVPGPEAGAGLGALAMLGVAYWAKRRRDEKALAA